MNEVMTGVIADARKEGRRAGLLEAAKVADRHAWSSEVVAEIIDHRPDKTILGERKQQAEQIATAIRALAERDGV